MTTVKRKVCETVSSPDLILEGDYGEMLAVRYFENTPLAGKYLIAVYKEISKIEGFLITPYFTNEYSKRRRVLWKH